MKPIFTKSSEFYRLLKVFVFMALVLPIDLLSQVNVTATIGTATGSYTTLSSAFANINNGTHKGVITLTLVSNITEPVIPTPLKASGVGSAVYNSISIVPSGNITVSGSPNAYRSLVELNGTANITIDGDDPSTSGVKNLTFSVNTTSSNSAAIHLASVSTSGTSNIIIRNCIIYGGRNSNVSLINTYGIVLSSDTLTNIASYGANHSQVTIDNNEIYRAFKGIFALGVSGGDFPNLKITNNIIGVPGTSANNIGESGIYLSGVSNNTTYPPLIEKNDIAVGLDNSSGYVADCVGIYLNNYVNGTIIRYNNIHDIINSTTTINNPSKPRPILTAGILIDGTSNASDISIYSNFVRDVMNNKKSTTVYSNGSILVYNYGTDNLKVNFNTFAQIRGNIYGSVSNYASSIITVIDSIGFSYLSELNNNIFYDANIGANATVIYSPYYDPYAYLSSMDKNCYYYLTGNIARISSSSLPKLTDWQLATLYDPQSFVEKPKFVSNTDLHIVPNTVTKLESNALASVIAFDVDKEPRGIFPATGKDIGADEFTGVVFVPSSIVIVTESINANPCIAVSRDIVANINAGNGLKNVILSYKTNGGVATNIPMTNTSGSMYTATIPTPFPINALISYRVFLLDTVETDTVTSNYYYFNDDLPEGAYLPVFNVTPNAGCINSPITMTYTLPLTYGLFNTAPTVTDSINFSDISQVTVGTINNTSTLNTLNGTIGTPTGKAGAYSNYTAIRIDSFSIGKKYPMTLTSVTNGLAKNYFAVYIDLNGDGDFNDANENMMKTLYVNTASGHTESATLFIPKEAKPGKTVMRVIVSNSPITSPTLSINYGETEDYSIFIRPLTYKWVINGVDATTTNPYTYTLTTIPTTVALKLIDTNLCTYTSPAISIAQSSSSMTAAITNTTSGCINDVRTLAVNITGGCAPYTYSWSNGVTSATNVVQLYNDTNYYSVTVTDVANNNAIATVQIIPVNPKLFSIDSGEVICNRGTTKLTAIPKTNSDSIVWYTIGYASNNNYLSMGKYYTTDLISTNTYYLVAARRVSIDSSGRTNIGTVTTNYGSYINTMTGLTFTTTQPMTLTKCDIYGAGSSATMNIGVIDRGGNIIAQTGNIAITFAASANTATSIPLNLYIPTPDSGYQLVMLSQSGITTLQRNTAGHIYPISSTKAMIITGGTNVGNYTSPNYYYYYNIKYSLTPCYGIKQPVMAKVVQARVPKIKQDLVYTQLCKGTPLTLSLYTDTFGNIFTWYKKNNYIKKDTIAGSLPIFNPTKDSLYEKYYLPVTTPTDTGDYYAIVSSSRTCIRDTFTRTVKVAFFPETKITTDITNQNLCLNASLNLTVKTDIGKYYNWYKDGVLLPSDTTKTLSRSNVSFSDSGNYQVTINDQNLCHSTPSSTSKVSIWNHPVINTNPIDTATVCEGDKYVVRAAATNYTSLQWYKDGAPVTNMIYDSLLLRNTTVADSGIYMLAATSYSSCIPAYSINSHLTVNPKPSLNIVTNNSFKYCEGDKMKLLASYTNGTNAAWYKDGFPTSLFSDSFVISSITLSDAGKYSYYVAGKYKCPSIVSDNKYVSVIQKATITGTLPNKLLCEDDSLTATFITNNSFIYQWQKNGVDIQSFTKPTLTIRYAAATDSGLYSLKVNSDAVCSPVYSTPFRLDISAKPRITIQPIGGTRCLGDSISLNALVSNGLTYQWRLNNANIGGATSSKYSIANLTSNQAGKYTLSITGNSPCTNIISDTAIVGLKSGATNAYISDISIYDAIEQCTDVNGWTYYSPSSDHDKFIFAVKKYQNVFSSNADVIVRPNSFQNIENTKNGFNGTYMIKRMWNLDVLSGAVSMPYDIKFYINSAEIIDVQSKIISLQNLYQNTINLTSTSLTWFQTKDSVPFTNKLLDNVVGSNLNFDYDVLSSVITGGKDGQVDYIEIDNVSHKGGGSAMIQFTGATKYITAIDDAENTIACKLLPNPNNGSFELLIETPLLENIDCTIVNDMGQNVSSTLLKHNTSIATYPFDMTHLASGNYIIVLRNNLAKHHVKLQIVH